jgi:hypothetical protein
MITDEGRDQPRSAFTSERHRSVKGSRRPWQQAQKAKMNETSGTPDLHVRPNYHDVSAPAATASANRIPKRNALRR